MKQNSIFRTSGFALALFASFNTFAQAGNNGNLTAATQISALSTNMAASDATLLENLKASNAKLYRNFTREFANASDIHLFPSEKNTVLYCKVSGVQNNILYTNKGGWLHTVRYYTSDMLPSDVSSTVTAAFPDFQQTRAAEVKTHAGTAYLVDIERKKQFKTIRVVNGEWDIYQEFTKQ